MRHRALLCALALAISCVHAAFGCATGDDVDGAEDDDDGGGQGGGGGGAGSGEGGSLLSTSSAGGSSGCDPDEGCGICGNGTVETPEECDDGNTTPGDGCDAACKVEAMTCNPDGVYMIQGAPVSYTCCSGSVNVNVSSFIFTASGASIVGSPSNPATMTGSPTTCPSGSFLNSGSIAGGCTETYTLDGDFSDADTWSGVYTITFTGADCDCFGGQLGSPCISQTYPVTAARQ